MSLHAFSPRSISSIIVEPRVLVRDSLSSLVTSYSYRVVGSYASAFDIQEFGDDFEAGRPKLAIIGAQSMERAIDEALRIREMFADSKIVVLLETVCVEDIQRMSEPTIDACIPLYVSRDVLMQMLEVVTSGPARVVVLADAPPSVQVAKSLLRRGGPAGAPQKQREITEKDRAEASNGASIGHATGDPGVKGDALEHPIGTSISDAKGSDQHVRKKATFEEDAGSRSQTNGTHLTNGANSAQAWNERTGNVIQRRNCIHKLRDQITSDADGSSDPARSPREAKISDRELQILDGLVKGHGNKMIARECAITEATVKVHMKSILRKICVANRTQAAIWALEHGYGTHLPAPRKVVQAADVQAARA
jgi:DNA-binding NarL/FixJ family response regulator